MRRDVRPCGGLARVGVEASAGVVDVDWPPDRMRELAAGIARAAAKPGTIATSPATLLGVAALDIPTT
ncbi:hypothetical protein AB0L82_31525 [Nocardia sp. NPDC052001]|uniref:hypothetical protein n=1 Tax=Nocardia sp. NPDC052001 TaxID=3154853 RepID=UPI0034204CBB